MVRPPKLFTRPVVCRGLPSGCSLCPGKVAFSLWVGVPIPLRPLRSGLFVPSFSLRVGFGHCAPPSPGGGGLGSRNFSSEFTAPGHSCLWAESPVLTRARAIFLASRLVARVLRLCRCVAGADAGSPQFFWRAVGVARLSAPSCGGPGAGVLQQGAGQGLPHRLPRLAPDWGAPERPVRGYASRTRLPRMVPWRPVRFPRSSPLCRFLSVRWGRRDLNRRV